MAKRSRRQTRRRRAKRWRPMYGGGVWLRGSNPPLWVVPTNISADWWMVVRFFPARGESTTLAERGSRAAAMKAAEHIERALRRRFRIYTINEPMVMAEGCGHLITNTAAW